MNLNMKSLIVAAVAAIPFFISPNAGKAADLPALQELGERIFWDKISTPPRMACVTCHDPRAGWTGSQSQTNRTQVAITGANPHTIGSRKPPSNAYAAFLPPFGPITHNTFPNDIILSPTGVFGGAFWDGRAEGNLPPEPNTNPNLIGDEVFIINGLLNLDLQAAYGNLRGPTAVQALGPFTNPVEQNRADRAGVCQHVQKAQYAELFQRAWTVPITCDDTVEKGVVDVNYKRIAVALAAFQATDKVISFSSRRDRALKCDQQENDGKFPLKCTSDPSLTFTDQENLGHDLFYSNLVTGPIGKATKVTNCTFCHNSSRNLLSDGTETQQLYTDFAYHNIGTPANPQIGQFDPNNRDIGLADHTKNLNLVPPVNPTDPPVHIGHWKAPTLRNVDKRPNAPFVKAYAHNGFFKSLKNIIHFYNTATSQTVPQCPTNVTTEEEALKQNCWPAPEHPVGAAIGTREAPGFIGNLGLTDAEEDAIVAYLKTLTDTVTPTQPKPFTPARN